MRSFNLPLFAGLACVTLLTTACQDDGHANRAPQAKTAPEQQQTPPMLGTMKDEAKSPEPRSYSHMDRPVSDTSMSVPSDRALQPDRIRTVPVDQVAGGVDRGTEESEVARRNLEASKYPADNSGVNIRDRNPGALTPVDQSESSSDIAITAGVRRALVGDSRFSMQAKNVKIITRDGHVTLRGAVATGTEGADITQLALSRDGVRGVTNELEVTQ